MNQVTIEVYFYPTAGMDSTRYTVTGYALMSGFLRLAYNDRFEWINCDSIRYIAEVPDVTQETH